MIRVAAEFVLIVLGVLVALLVDEWRQTSNEQQLRDDYFVGLSEDITAELSYLDYVADLCRKRMASADRILLFLGRPAGASDPTVDYVAPTTFVADSLAFDLSEASKMQFFVPEAVVWEDLMATGNLRLIEDAEIRRHVSRYYTQIRYQTRDLEMLQERFEILSTYLMSKGISSSSPLGLDRHVTRLSSFSELPAYIRSARDTQAEVLQRTLDLREYAERAFASVNASQPK